MKRAQFWLLLMLLGAMLLAGGVVMRVTARNDMAATEQRLIAARPLSPAALQTRRGEFAPAEGPPTEIRLPGLGLWNTLEPVTQQIAWEHGEIVSAWDVRDAGWHMPSGWPGWGHNVVIAGHSPSRDPQIWSRSVFRQLAY